MTYAFLVGKGALPDPHEILGPGSGARYMYGVIRVPRDSRPVLDYRVVASTTQAWAGSLRGGKAVLFLAYDGEKLWARRVKIDKAVLDCRGRSVPVGLDIRQSLKRGYAPTQELIISPSRNPPAKLRTMVDTVLSEARWIASEAKRAGAAVRRILWLTAHLAGGGRTSIDAVVIMERSGTVKGRVMNVLVRAEERVELLYEAAGPGRLRMANSILYQLRREPATVWVNAWLTLAEPAPAPHVRLCLACEEGPRNVYEGYTEEYSRRAPVSWRPGGPGTVRLYRMFKGVPWAGPGGPVDAVEPGDVIAFHTRRLSQAVEEYSVIARAGIARVEEEFSTIVSSGRAREVAEAFASKVYDAMVLGDHYMFREHRKKMAAPLDAASILFFLAMDAAVRALCPGRRVCRRPQGRAPRSAAADAVAAVLLAWPRGGRG